MFQDHDLVHDNSTEKLIVRTDIWPALSLDKSTCGFYLRGFLKDTVYKTNLLTLNELIKT